MEAKVTWSFKAQKSLKQVYEFLFEQYGEDYAERYLALVYRSAFELADHPSKGRPIVGIPKTRRWKLTDWHFVVYVISKHGITIRSFLSFKQDNKGF
jgi:plasmid stabilization system protein ParE